MTTAAEQLAILRAMPRTPEQSDHRGQAELDRDMAMEQIAEDRKAARRGDFDGTGSRAWLAARRAG